MSEDTRDESRDEALPGEGAMVKSSTDEAQIRKGRAAERRIAAKRAADFAVLLGMPEGRRVLWHMLTFAGMHVSAADVLASHAHMAYREGKRDVGRMLIENMGAADPAAYTEMQREKAALEYR
jgi:hypothetical protein